MIKTSSSPPGKTTLIRDWTKGSIIQNILQLSWPMIVLLVLYSANLILEMIWVGRLGAASIAGVGVAGITLALVLTIKSGFGAGERALVARFVGAGDLAGANQVAGQGFVIGAAYSVIIAVIGILLIEPIFSVFGLQADAAAEGVKYLRIILTGWITEAFWITSFTVMQASGDTVTPMKIAVVIRVVNAAICPFLVLGWWIFPRMGVSGAAITYLIATALGAILCLWVLFGGKTRLRLTVNDFRPDFNLIWRILKIGIPSSAMGLGKAFGDLVMTWFMIPFGTLALAAHNLLFRIETFINTPGIGVSIGASVLVGQNLGAHQPTRASKSGWLAVGMATGFMLICSILLLVWSDKIIGIFNVEPDLIKVGVIFLRIAVTGYLFMSVVTVMQNCISGSGDTVPPMLITVAMLWVVQLPLAYLLSRFTDLGAYGIRWAIITGFVAGAIAFIIYFWQGRWKHKKV